MVLEIVHYYNIKINVKTEKNKEGRKEGNLQSKKKI